MPATVRRKERVRGAAHGEEDPRKLSKKSALWQMLQQEPPDAVAGCLLGFPPVMTVLGGQTPYFAMSKTASGTTRPRSAYFWPLSFILCQNHRTQHLFTPLEIQPNPPAPFSPATKQLSLTQCLSATPGLIWMWPTDLEVKGSTVHYQSLGPVILPGKTLNISFPFAGKPTIIIYKGLMSLKHIRTIQFHKDLMSSHWVKNSCSSFFKSWQEKEK